MSSVLIVEPDQQVRIFIAGILADFGHQVQQCRDAEDAAIWLEQARFDVLTTDLALDFVKSPPMLTLSGIRQDPNVGSRDRASRLSDKPFRLADLHRLVAAITAIAPTYALAA